MSRHFSNKERPAAPIVDSRMLRDASIPGKASIAGALQECFDVGLAGTRASLGTNAARADMRCAEIAVVLAGYVRVLGWPARGHAGDASLAALERLAQRAGVAKDCGELHADGVRDPLLAQGNNVVGNSPQEFSAVIRAD